MKTVLKVILVFLGLLLIGAALFLAALNFNLLPGLAVPVPAWVDETVLLSSASVLLLLALIFIALGFRSGQKKVKNAVLKGSEFGAVMISIPAIENMVLRVVQQTQGLKDVSRNVAYTADGLLVKIRVKAMPDVALPDLISDLQSKTKEYLESTTGITVSEVAVTVDNIIMDQAVTR
jgi:uncharacterized alkaline shock family protein YloU